MKNTEEFTDREWEELASLLSDEKEEQTDLLGRFYEGEGEKTGETWKGLKDMNNNDDIDIDKAWNKVRSRLTENGYVISNSPVRIHYIRRTLLRIAAVGLILLGLGTAFIYFSNSDLLSKKISVVANNDQKNVSISLPDGSKVYLNRNSEFTYKKSFGEHGRYVKLNGEAFFEIAPDTKKPFIIDAGKAKIKVVGTSFNVITNNTKSEVEVFVKTGKVLLSDNSGSNSIQLDPGYIGTMSTDNPVKKINTNQNYLSWKTGHLDYSGQKLSVVFSDLKRVFNMDIVAEDSSILENPWHSPIDNLSQDTIIQLICGSFNLSYVKDGSVFHLYKK